MAINTQTIRVDLNTGKSTPIAFSHQNDNNRQLTFALYNNGVAYTPSSTTAKFGYVSPIVNGQYTVISGNNMATGTVSGNTVTVTLPSTYTAISGVGMLTMILTTSNNTLRPVNIKLVVQRSADGSDVIAGASDLPDRLTDIADEMFQQYLSQYFPPDTTLAVSGKAADSKAVGDEFSDVRSEIGDVRDEMYYLTASSAAQMTDTSAVYKYTGNELGYTTNALYYHDGTSWKTVYPSKATALSDDMVQLLIDTFYAVTWNMPKGEKYLDAINGVMGTNLSPSFHGAISMSNVLSSVGYTGLTYDGTRFRWESMASGNCIIALNQNVKRVYGTSPPINYRIDLAFKRFSDGSFIGYWGNDFYKFTPNNGSYSATRIYDVVVENSFEVPHNGEEVTLILENGNLYVYRESETDPMIIHDANIIGFVGHAGYSGYSHQLQSMEAF